MEKNTEMHTLVISGRTLIVLVNWRRPGDTNACVDALLKLTDCQIDIVIAENGSPDSSFADIAQHLLRIGQQQGQVLTQTHKEVVVVSDAKNIRITLVNTGANLGFAGGNNYAYRHVTRDAPTRYTHAWFLNNDTEPQADSLSCMLAKFANAAHKVGMVGSTMVYDFDRQTIQALGGSRYQAVTGLMQEMGNGQRWPLAVNEDEIAAQLSYVCGASMLVSAEFIRDVGLMAEDYFIFFEEIDWAQRGRKAGYTLAYAADAVVFHKEGVAIGTGKGTERSLLAEYYGLRNKLLVTWRFFPWAMPSVWLISWLQALRRLINGRRTNAWLMARTLLGLGKRPG
jgi:GT2 family glycosyltransferase